MLAVRTQFFASMGDEERAGRLFTAASTGNLEVVKNLITANGELIRAADLDGLYPGFTGRAQVNVLCFPTASQLRRGGRASKFGRWTRAGGGGRGEGWADAIAADTSRTCSCSAALVRTRAAVGRQRKEATLHAR